VELPEDLDSAFRAYCGERGAKLADEIRLAMRRHLANPPPKPTVPPLPPVPTTAGEPADEPTIPGRGERTRGNRRSA
jgi:hypothetical protein